MKNLKIKMLFDIERLTVFNGLRGMMCLLVVLFHYTYRFYELSCSPPPTSIFSQGGVIGVCVFFLMSGFLTVHTIGRFDRVGGGNWLEHKYKRLYYDYAIACIVIFLSMSLSPLEFRKQPDVKTLLLNLTMIPGLGGSIDTSHWYVMTLVCFYAEIFIIKKFDKLKHPATYAVLAMVYCTALVSRKAGIIFDDTTSFITVYLANPQPYIGVLIYLALTSSSRWWIGVAAFSLLTRNPFVCLFVALFCCLLLLPSSRMPHIINIFNFKMFVHIGVISYTWYLVHQNIGYIIIQTSLTCWNDITISTILALLGTYILAEVLWRGINEVKGHCKIS